MDLFSVFRGVFIASSFHLSRRCTGWGAGIFGFFTLVSVVSLFWGRHHLWTKWCREGDEVKMCGDEVEPGYSAVAASIVTIAVLREW